MPKQLINLIGAVIAVGILLLAIVLGVVPQLSAAAATSSQADQVATTNALYQARINQLDRQKKNLPSINATVAKLHRQIPAEYRLDDVFLLVAQAANTANATISSVTAGDPAAFEPRSAPVPAGAPSPAPNKTPAPAGSPSATPSTGTGTGAGTKSGGGPAGGREQIEISIQVTVPDTAAASKFLDALRAGPRLLANVTSVASGSSSASVSLQVSGLAFASPSTAMGGK